METHERKVKQTQQVHEESFEEAKSNDNEDDEEEEVAQRETKTKTRNEPSSFDNESSTIAPKDSNDEEMSFDLEMERLAAPAVISE